MKWKDEVEGLMWGRLRKKRRVERKNERRGLKRRKEGIRRFHYSVNHCKRHKTIDEDSPDACVVLVAIRLQKA